MSFVEDLSKRGKPVLDDRNVVRFDHNTDSPMSMHQTIMSLALKQEAIDKAHPYAVIIGIVDPEDIDKDGFSRRAYICDVFVREEDRITYELLPDELTWKNDLTEDEVARRMPYKLFYPTDDDLMNNSLIVGSVVIVSLADQYPNHTGTEATRYDNKITHRTNRYIKVNGYPGGTSSSGGSASPSTPFRSRDTGFDEGELIQIMRATKIKRGLSSTPTSWNSPLFEDGDFNKFDFCDADPFSIDDDAKFSLEKIFDSGVKVEIVSGVGFRTVYGKEDVHFGFDLRAPEDTIINSCIPWGKVHSVVNTCLTKGNKTDNCNRGMGNQIIIAMFRNKSDKDMNINPYAYFIYQHLNTVNVSPGDDVSLKEGASSVRVSNIGTTGSTGQKKFSPHLHIEMRNNPDPLKPCSLNLLAYHAKPSPFGQFSSGQIEVSLNGVKRNYKLPLEKLDIVKVKKDSLTGKIIASDTLIPTLTKTETWDLTDRTKPGGASVEYEDFSGRKSTFSPMTNFPKMKIVDFVSDLSVYNKNPLEQGNINIKIREDIRDKLYSIKEILNKFGVPLALEYFDFNLKTDTSYLSKLGLEIHINKFSSLNPKNNPKYNDYYISPNKNKKIYNNGYLLDIYAKIKTNIDEYNGFKSQYKSLEFYDITNTYRKTKPNIVVENGNFLNISEIFRKHDFHSIEPNYEFFNLSMWEKSNWWIFQSYSKLESGITFEQALKKVYKEENNAFWHNSTKIKWDGKRFI